MNDRYGTPITAADIEPGVNLRYADLDGANLRNADLRNADLDGVNLAGAYLDGAKGVG